MKLSNRSIYAVRALFDLAYHGGERPVQLREVACREEIPARFLEQIFQEVRRAGLIESTRGPRGGYQLARTPAEITLADILAALGEAPDFVSPGESGECAPDTPGKDQSWQVADALCAEIMLGVQRTFAHVTLAQLMQRAEASGLARACVERFVYVI
jgi:Rrf2 family transcriptional regulator, iron-sulfur cluster assembly transcription factor